MGKKRRPQKPPVPEEDPRGAALRAAQQRDRRWRVDGHERSHHRWKRFGLWFALGRILSILGTAYSFHAKLFWGGLAGVALAGLLTWLEKVATSQQDAAQAALHSEWRNRH